MGREAETFYKCLADMISNKRQQKYSATIGWLRCRMSFASWRSSIMCIRGSRSSIHRPIFGDFNISLATSEARDPSASWITWLRTYVLTLIKQLINIFLKIIIMYNACMKCYVLINLLLHLKNVPSVLQMLAWLASWQGKTRANKICQGKLVRLNGAFEI
jgi:hypothetical protein